MKALPTQDRALKKRVALIQAAIAEFSTAGFEVATAKSIAAAAGVATGTFYQYFENKNDILCVIASERFSHLHRSIQITEPKSLDDIAKADPASMTPAIEAQFEQTLRFIYDFHADQTQLHQVLEQRRALDDKLQAIMQEGETILRSRVLMFVQTFNLDNAEIVADNLFAMAEGLVHRQVFDNAKHEPEQVLKIGAQMLSSYFMTKANS